ncbi:hypothetical protein BDA96_06G093500 [Sorghum bicolor]|uniref:Uncharacterized protein n=2 Tax=Sorghum bicolor TaxID=4558 RepID=A0A921QQE9_SORBI|nr:hypothetical protein BDA96_06G093500 [Sorghum bicolor]KXG26339.1 hypothetical protein SORBI_3006G084900 [Sorghum bicolor]
MPPIPKALRFSFPFHMACEINVNQIKKERYLLDGIHYVGCKQRRGRMRATNIEGLIWFGLSRCLPFLLLSSTPSSSVCLHQCFIHEN